MAKLFIDVAVAAVFAVAAAVAVDRLHPVDQGDESVCELAGTGIGWYNNHLLDDGLLRCAENKPPVQKLVS
jgi:hypothetical protein